jgi:hypothetical protein
MPGVDELVGYESELNRFMPRYRKAVLCLYDLERFCGGSSSTCSRPTRSCSWVAWCSRTPTISHPTSSSQPESEHPALAPSSPPGAAKRWAIERPSPGAKRMLR